MCKRGYKQSKKIKKKRGKKKTPPSTGWPTAKNVDYLDAERGKNHRGKERCPNTVWQLIQKGWELGGPAKYRGGEKCTT